MSTMGLRDNFHRPRGLSLGMPNEQFSSRRTRTLVEQSKQHSKERWRPDGTSLGGNQRQ